MACKSCGQRYRMRKQMGTALKKATVVDTRAGLSKTVSAPPTEIPENIMKASDNSTLGGTPEVQVQPKEGVTVSDPTTEQFLPSTGQCADTGKPEENSLTKSDGSNY